MSIKKNGSEIRARLIQVYLDHGKRCWDPEVCVDEPTNTDEWKGCCGHIVDKMLGEIQDRRGYVWEPVEVFLSGQPDPKNG